MEDLIQADPRTATQRSTALTATPSQTLPRIAQRAGRGQAFAPGRPPGGRQLELPVWGGLGRVISRGSIPPAWARGQQTAARRARASARSDPAGDRDEESPKAGEALLGAKQGNQDVLELQLEAGDP